MFRATGKLIYDPKTDGASEFRSWWAKLDVPQSIIRYYQYWVKRELGIRLNTPMWKSHVSVIRGEVPTTFKSALWKKYQGKEIEFTYSPNLRMSETYVWLPVESPELEAIRVELGLRPKPKVPFHLTIGNTKNLEKITEEIKLPFVTFPWENKKIVDELWRKPKSN